MRTFSMSSSFFTGAMSVATKLVKRQTTMPAPEMERGKVRAPQPAA